MAHTGPRLCMIDMRAPIQELMKKVKIGPSAKYSPYLDDIAGPQRHYLQCVYLLPTSMRIQSLIHDLMTAIISLASSS